MKTLNGYLIGAIVALSLALSGSDAFAKRLGGGQSFGSRPSYSTPYRAPQSSQGIGSSSATQPGAGYQQPAYSAAVPRNQAVRDSLAQRGGFMRMLGGLALGGLLGAMLFGGGFEGINFFDLLIFGGIAFLLFKLLASRRRQTETMGAYSPAGGGEYGEPPYARKSHQEGRAGFDTDVLFGKNRPSTGGAGACSYPGIPSIPADFDAKAFLAGAKAAYDMMQRAWDTADLGELRALTTDKVFAELQDQLRRRGEAPNHTELLKVEAQILEVRDAGSDREVTVLFDVLMREERGEPVQQVREVWHFTRPRNSRQPTWFLDGIQQIED
jgi:predicted lipid-binding transport protein (Tim44 family)